MIPCQKCNHDNPLGTMFCHSCGARLEVRTDHIMKSVAATDLANREKKLFEAGRSAVSLAVFLLCCAVILDWLMAPPLPAPVVPDAADIAVLGDTMPAWATAAQPGAVAAAAPTARRANGTFTRLDLRRLRAHAVAKAFGIESASLAALRAPLLGPGARKEDGSWSAPDPLAGTALATLALQAWPDDAESAKAAAAGRAWLAKQAKDLGRATPLARSLAVMALLDGEALEPAVRNALGNRVVDGKAAAWQILSLPLFSAETRPSELVALRAARNDTVWTALLGLGAAEPPPEAAVACSAETAATATTGEARMLWAYTAWQWALAPEALATTMHAWSTQPPAPVDAELTKAAGASAPAAVAMLTLGAPLRVPPQRLLP